MMGIMIIFVTIVMVTPPTDAFTFNTKSITTLAKEVIVWRATSLKQPHCRHRRTSIQLSVIPGQGYDPNNGGGVENDKDRRSFSATNPFISINRSAPQKKKKKVVYKKPYSPQRAKKRLATPWSSSRSSQAWSSQPYIPTRPPSIASDAADLIKNIDYIREQSQEAALAADELLQKSRADLLRRSQEAADRAESFLISSREAAVRAAKARQERHFTETTRFIATPFIVAVASFFLYPTTSKAFHAVAQFCSQNKWVPVDGGNLQWSVLLPALNGVVMTAVSLLYANLISTTGTQLRQRQINVQESLRTEVSGIRGLAQLLPYYPDNGRAVFGTHLMAYIQQLVIELDPKSNYMDLRTIIPPLLDYRDELHRISMEDVIHGNIRERSYEMIDRLATGRQNRVTALQTTFPPLHYGTITTLSIAILFVFLIETDRPVILFTNNFQLRLIWGLLVGTITAIYCIGIDLNYPFVGTYCVPSDRLLEESDEILREIKGTFPDRQLLEKSNGLNGSDVIVLLEEDDDDDGGGDYDDDGMKQEATLPSLTIKTSTSAVTSVKHSPSPTTSQPQTGMTYVDTIQQPQQPVYTETNAESGLGGGSSISSSSALGPALDWSKMTPEEMNRRWIEGR